MAVLGVLGVCFVPFYAPVKQKTKGIAMIRLFIAIAILCSQSALAKEAFPFNLAAVGLSGQIRSLTGHINVINAGVTDSVAGDDVILTLIETRDWLEAQNKKIRSNLLGAQVGLLIITHKNSSNYEEGRTWFCAKAAQGIFTEQVSQAICGERTSNGDN